MESASPPRLSDIARAGEIKRVLWLVLLLNWSVSALKILIGTMTRSLVILTDGIHSFSDGLSNIIGLVAVSIAAHPADKTHPYGHRKFETIASLVISFSLFFAAGTIAKEAFFRLGKPTAVEVNFLSFAVTGVTFVVNLFTALWERRRGQRLGSDLLVADSYHTFSDVLVTSSVFAALVGIGLGFPMMDGIVAFGIAGFIAWIALGILLRSSEVLTDHAVIDDEWVRNIVMRVQGVRDCHEIRSRGRPDDIRVDLHVLVDPRMSVEDSHKLANLIERDIRAARQGITDVLVHIEPLHHDHKELHGS